MLVAIVGPLGPGQLACLRSWRRRGWTTVFLHLSDSGPAPRAEWLADHYFHFCADALVTTPAEFVSTIALVNPNGVAALSYAVTRQLHELARCSDWPAATSVWATPLRTLEFLESKVMQNDLALHCGLGVLPTWRIAADGDIPGVPDSMFPAVLRPDGAGAVRPSFKVELIASADQLHGRLARFDRIIRPLVLQSFVPGTNLIVHGARSAISGEVAQAAFDVSEMLDGVSLVVRCTTIDAGTLAACAEFVRRAEIEGVYHFEFRKNSDGQLFFLDFNGRLGGTTGKVLRLGYDEPALLVQCFTQRSLTLDRCDDSAMASNRMAIAKAALRSLRARMTIFDYPLQSPGRRIAGLMSGLFRWRDEILHFGELRSGLAFMLSQLADRFRR